jgi:hypothetical protein
MPILVQPEGSCFSLLALGSGLLARAGTGTMQAWPEDPPGCSSRMVNQRIVSPPRTKPNGVLPHAQRRQVLALELLPLPNDGLG